MLNKLKKLEEIYLPFYKKNPKQPEISIQVAIVNDPDIVIERYDTQGNLEDRKVVALQPALTRSEYIAMCNGIRAGLGREPWKI